MDSDMGDPVVRPALTIADGSPWKMGGLQLASRAEPGVGCLQLHPGLETHEDCAMLRLCTVVNICSIHK